jgi:hypothetical protein
LALEIEPGSIEHLSQVISHVVAPAFLLGAVASFISILVGRENGVIERLREINDLPDQGHVKSALKSDMPRLRQRAALLHRAIFLAISSGIVAAILIVVAFGAALLSFTHAWASAILFIVSLGLLSASLVVFGMEVRIGLNEYDHL